MGALPATRAHTAGRRQQRRRQQRDAAASGEPVLPHQAALGGAACAAVPGRRSAHRHSPLAVHHCVTPPHSPPPPLPPRPIRPPSPHARTSQGALNNDLAKKLNTRNEFDAAISETEGACESAAAVAQRARRGEQRRASDRRCAASRGRSVPRRNAHAPTVPSPRASLPLVSLALAPPADMKILESSQTLLSVLKRESTLLTKKKGNV